jgi:CheY-like chemotaxis protein
MKDFTDKILLCDDSAPFLRLFAESVIDTGDKSILDHIIFCENVDDALTQYAIHRPLVVLMDIRMPGKDGIEGAKLIREIDSNARIIFLSNYPQDPEAAKAVSDHLAVGTIDKDAGTGFLASIIGFIVKVAMKAV